jgi:hypothetical protein
MSRRAGGRGPSRVEHTPDFIGAVHPLRGGGEEPRPPSTTAQGGAGQGRLTLQVQFLAPATQGECNRTHVGRGGVSASSAV